MVTNNSLQTHANQTPPPKPINFVAGSQTHHKIQTQTINEPTLKPITIINPKSNPLLQYNTNPGHHQTINEPTARNPPLIPNPKFN
jgi:hypothetical protein